ncbi:MAG: cupredoxin domain-containing protein [Candidatus Altiarchaeota archaeon]
MRTAVIGIFIALLVLASGCTKEPSVPATTTVTPTSAETTVAVKPSIKVSTNPAGSTVSVDSLYVDEDGFVVIHKFENGQLGEAVGNTYVTAGQKSDVEVGISGVEAPAELIAMLHYDDGDGVYEFPGPDGPVKIGDMIVMTNFSLVEATGIQCIDCATGYTGGGCATVDDVTGEIVSPPPCVLEETTTSVTVSVKEFDITAKRFSFTPSTIRVKQGDNVRIRLTSADVTHGFAISEYEIDEKVSGGETKTFEFTADKEGMFTFKCSVYCGTGHMNMKGTLIVE